MGELGQTAWGTSLLQYSWLPQPPQHTRSHLSGIKPKSSRTKQFWALLVTSLIWNALTGVACYYFYDNWKKGIGQGCLGIALCVVCPIAMLLVIGTVRQFLILFNPTPVIHLSSLEAPPGGSIDIRWTIKGKSKVIKLFSILLEGKEFTKYVQGTDIQTDHHVFVLLPVHEALNEAAIKQGQARILIPTDAIHSFDSGNNKIQWTLKIRGSISKWPDLEEEYEIIVRPFTLAEMKA